MSLLYLGIGRSVAVAPQVDHAMHRHATIQITLALDQPFLFKTETSEWTRTSAVAVHTNVSHQAKEFHGLCVSIHLLPEPKRAQQPTLAFPGGQKFRFLDERDLSRYVAYFRDLPKLDPPCSEVFRMTEQMVADVTGIAGPVGEIDGRLLKILERIQSVLPTPIRLRKLAHEACLSEGRFLHLFKEQLGITLRQYIVYQRVMRATAEIYDGASLTAAALNAGFSDSSHFTRKFTQLTGFRPSRLKQLRGSVRTHSCFSSRCVYTPHGLSDQDPCADCLLFMRSRNLRP